jgi:ribosomal protein L21E
MKDAVEVDSPGSPFHGRRGWLVDIIGHKYVVEFYDGSYALESFTGRELRAMIKVCV